MLGPMTATPEKQMDILDAILLIEGEEGFSPEQYHTAFQLLIDDGIVWKLQGFYGRSAKALIETGFCHAKAV